MLWSSASIPGSPALLVIDTSHNLHGWESEFSDRIYSGLRKRGLCLKSEGPVRVDSPEELAPHLKDAAGLNSILLLGHGIEESLAPDERLEAYWEWLDGQDWLSPLLSAVCMWESYDPGLSERILAASDGFAPMAVAQKSPLSPREAGLYFLKFFTELDLHSKEAITGRMVWFSDSKARELLKRRRLPGVVGARC
jgi:hypothetical protein